MSYRSSLESSLRNAAAIKTLNKLRHEIIGRENSKLSDSDKTILLEAFGFLLSTKITKKFVQYSFHSTGDYHSASAYEVAKSLSVGMDGLYSSFQEGRAVIEKLSIRIKQNQVPEREYLPLIEEAMDYIGRLSMEQPESPFKMEGY